MTLTSKAGLVKSVYDLINYKFLKLVKIVIQSGDKHRIGFNSLLSYHEIINPILINAVNSN